MVDEVTGNQLALQKVGRQLRTHKERCVCCTVTLVSSFAQSSSFPWCAEIEVEARALCGLARKRLPQSHVQSRCSAWCKTLSPANALFQRMKVMLRSVEHKLVESPIERKEQSDEQDRNSKFTCDPGFERIWERKNAK